MVDAGYLLRQAVDILSGSVGTDRRELDIFDYPGMVALLDAQCRAAFDFNDASRELLRVYWYDGVPRSGPTAQQNELLKIPGVHFRAGTVNFEGRQKGVDSTLVTDLIDLSANHAITDAAIISGDGDLAVGITRAQMNGVRVAVVGLEEEPIGHKQSFEILCIADRVRRIGAQALRTVMRHCPPQSAGERLVEDKIRELVAAFVASAELQEDPFEDVARQMIRQSIYRDLMAHVGAGLGQWLSKEEKNFARRCFCTHFDKDAHKRADKASGDTPENAAAEGADDGQKNTAPDMTGTAGGENAAAQTTALLLLPEAEGYAAAERHSALLGGGNSAVDRAAEAATDDGGEPEHP